MKTPFKFKLGLLRPYIDQSIHYREYIDLIFHLLPHIVRLFNC
jgi:hypothetical protein